MKRPHCWLAFAAIALSLANPGRSSFAQGLSTEALVAGAATICEGQVLSLESAWSDDHGIIFTIVEIAVSATYKGDLARHPMTRAGDGRLRLRLLGGEVDEVGMAVPHQAAFEENERVILFLGENTQSLFPIVGDEQGKLTVVSDATTNQVMIRERNVSRARFLDEVVRKVDER